MITENDIVPINNDSAAIVHVSDGSLLFTLCKAEYDVMEFLYRGFFIGAFHKTSFTREAIDRLLEVSDRIKEAKR